MSPCHAVLVKAPLPASLPPLQALQAVVHGTGLASASTRLHVAEDDSILHLDIGFAAALQVSAEQLQALVHGVAACFAMPAEMVSAARLALEFERGAIEAGAHAPFHYVVETNAAADWFDELVHWYDIEHMPGLAAVPGCLRARRYVNLDGGPQSCATYELTSPGVLTSAPWLAVRATEWASRVRPNFRDTLRTMFRSMPAVAPAGIAIQA